MGDVCRTTVPIQDSRGAFRAIKEGYGGWCLMILAMMLPLQTEAIRHVAYSIPWYRRKRAIALFLVGYVLLWLFLGVAIRLAGIGVGILLPSLGTNIEPLMPAVGFAIAAAWACHPARLQARFSCGGTIPLRAMGFMAYVDCLRYGLIMGWACLRTCWAPMAALMIAHHGVGMMAMVAGLLIYERTWLPHRSNILGYVWATFSVALALVVIR